MITLIHFYGASNAIYSIIQLVLLVLISALTILYSNYKRLSKKIENIPGPKMIPIIGNTLEITSTKVILPKLMAFKEKYGKVFRLLVGNKILILISDPKIAQRLLSKHFSKGDTYKFLEPWIQDGLLTSETEKWRQRRKLIIHAFHTKILEQFVDVFNRESEILIGKLNEDVDKASVDISDKISRCAMDIICETAMGVTVNAQNNPDCQYLKASKAILHIVSDSMFSLMANLPPLHFLTRNYWKTLELLKILHGESRKVIELRRTQLKNEKIRIKNDERDKLSGGDSGVKKRMALLDLLLEAEIDGQPLSDKDIQEEVDTFLFAGHDSGTNGLCYLLYAIANNARVQELLLKENISVLGPDPSIGITLKDIKSMKYLDLTLKESLRRYTIVPFVSRRLEEDDECDGYKFPKGSSICPFFYAMHMDPHFYPDPEYFRPERFSPDFWNEKNNFAYGPFSLGPRNCLGQKFGMVEVKLIVSKILRKFELLPAEPRHDLQLQAEPVLKSINGFRIKLRKR